MKNKEWNPISIFKYDPNSDDSFLILGSSGGMATAYYDGYSFVPDGVQCTYDMAECLIDIGDITHWMNLPKKPR